MLFRSRWRSRVRDLPEQGGELPSVTMLEEITTPGEGQIRAMVTVAGNPVTEADQQAKLARCVEVARRVWGD